MNLNVASMPKEEALEKFNQYKDAVRVSRAAADRMMMNAFRLLSEGRGILNLRETISKGGVHEETWLPKLAVMRADQEMCWFVRGVEGSGCYSEKNARNVTKARLTTRLQFRMPADTFPRQSWSEIPEATRRRYRESFSTPVPPIPPEHRPSDAFSKYCILWEVDVWEPHAPPGDPVLLRPIGGDLYAVMAVWDLTSVERMVLGAILGAGN